MIHNFYISWTRDCSGRQWGWEEEDKFRINLKQLKLKPRWAANLKGQTHSHNRHPLTNPTSSPQSPHSLHKWHGIALDSSLQNVKYYNYQYIYIALCCSAVSCCVHSSINNDDSGWWWMWPLDMDGVASTAEEPILECELHEWLNDGAPRWWWWYAFSSTNFCVALR